MNLNEIESMETGKNQQAQAAAVTRPGNPSLLALTLGKQIRCVRSAKKLLARLISAFIRGELPGEDARTLTYMITQYCVICRDVDFENRLEALERRGNCEQP